MSIRKLILWVIGITVFLYLTISVDNKLATALTNLLPQSINEWKPFLHVVFWIVLAFAGFWLAVLIALLVTGIIAIILSLFGVSLVKTSPMKKQFKSKWAQKLEEMQAEQDKRMRK